MRHALRSLVLVSLLAPLIAAGSDGQPPDRDLPNLRPVLTAGWDYPIVPRDDDDATIESVHLTPTLPGYEQLTYWNSHILNDGDAATPEGFVWRVYVDDDEDRLDYSYTTQSVPAGYAVHSLNKGPQTVDGGRHTFELRIDEDNYVPETNENDNNLAHQFIWTPRSLSPGVAITEYPPPDPTGGWGAVPSGETLWYNCRGYRFVSSGWWNVVWINSGTGCDYDCRLHEPSTGSLSGFATNVGYSSRPAGYIDGVIVNRNTMGPATWDVGVINESASPYNFLIEHVTSQEFDFGTSVAATMPFGQFVQLWEFYLSTAHVGWVMFELQADASMDGLWAYEYDPDFTRGAIGSCDLSMTTTGGACRGFRELGSVGYHCVAIVRDPTLGGSAFDYTLTVTTGLPDFTPNSPAGWHSACVPHPAADGTPTHVALPDTLHGNSVTTYPNVAMRNATPVPYPDASPYMKMYWEYDERPLSWIGFHPIDGYDAISWNGTTPSTIPGGRHTYALRIDKNDEIAELDEDNNDYGEQYCWSPMIVPLGSVVMRSLPADLTAGWDIIGSGETHWFNCDGLRMPASTTAYWQAMAVLPVDATDDVDVRLHEVLTGVKDGFAGNLNYSDFGPGESDYVLVNFNHTGRRAFDAGVVRYAGDGQYRAHAIDCAYLGTYPEGTYGPYSMSSLALLRLYEMGLAAGTYRIRLDQLSGDADLGMTLHPASEAYQWKGQGVSGGFADDAGPGQDEEIIVTVPSSGYYCLGIWKSGSSDLNLTSSYTLQIDDDVTPVLDPGADVPLVTRLQSVYPNPFNPHTTIAFDLGDDQDVTLGIYDVRGRQVRRLVGQRLPAGHHTVAWDGHDDGGQVAASGVYLVRLIADDMQALRKIVLTR